MKRNPVALRGDARRIDERPGNPDDDAADGVFELMFILALSNHGELAVGAPSGVRDTGEEVPRRAAPGE